jgi:hypothetical protein
MHKPLMKMDDLGVTMGNPHEEKDNPPVKNLML